MLGVEGRRGERAVQALVVQYFLPIGKFGRFESGHFIWHTNQGWECERQDGRCVV
jgi:hypothetical protein